MTVVWTQDAFPASSGFLTLGCVSLTLEGVALHMDVQQWTTSSASMQSWAQGTNAIQGALTVVGVPLMLEGVALNFNPQAWVTA